jgi:hypothetical protein
MLEFDAGGIGRELPVGFGVMDIAISLPSSDLLDEDLLVRDAAVETLHREIGEFAPTAADFRREADLSIIKFSSVIDVQTRRTNH